MGAAGVTMIEVNSGLSRQRRVLAGLSMFLIGLLLVWEVGLFGLTRWTVVGLLVGLAAALAYGVRLRQFEALLTRWRVKRLWVEVMGAAALVGLAFLSLYHFEWSGFGAQLRPPFVEQSKTLWDWLQLLIVPIILGLGGLAINITLQRNEQSRAEKQAEVDREIAKEREETNRQIAKERDETERKIAEGRAQDQRLRAYLDRISELLLDRQLGDAEQVKDEVKALARTLTLTTLRRLDGERKAEVVRFLYEAGLIGNKESEAIVSLRDADLKGLTLAGLKLNNINLSRANLENSHLLEVDLSYSNLSNANISNSYLSRASLIGANLNGTNLTKSYLGIAILRYADLRGAILVKTHLMGAELREANLGGAYLDDALLKRANLRGADLEGSTAMVAQLMEARLDANTTLPDGTLWHKGLWD